MNENGVGVPGVRPGSTHPGQPLDRLEAATTLFLRNGYLGTSCWRHVCVRPEREGRQPLLRGSAPWSHCFAELFSPNPAERWSYSSAANTSVDDIAAQAHVSKQTVYTHFADKEQLFAELIRGNISRVDSFIESVTASVGETNALEEDLRAFAHRHVRAVLLPEAVQLRRLVIGEAGRFPHLAREYYEHVPQRVVAALAQQLGRLAERCLLRIPDPLAAANHLAWLILGPPLDAAMFGALTARAPHLMLSTGPPTWRWMCFWRRTVEAEVHHLC